MSRRSPNRQVFERLLADGRMRLKRGPIFDEDPPPLPDPLDNDKVEGMLLGIAIGDALGSPTEGARSWYRRHYPAPLDYLTRPTTPSDDTQLSGWTLEQMLNDGGFVPANVAQLFVQRGPEITGIGSVVTQFLENARHGRAWETWAPSGANALGNGAVMRVAPTVLPFLRRPTADLWVDAALAGRITHDSALSTASCVAVVRLLWHCLGSRQPPEPRGWADEVVNVLRPLDDCRYHPPPSHPPAALAGFRGTVSDLIEQFVLPAYERQWTVRQACDPWGDGWGSGPYLFETMPSVVFVLMKHGHDFEEAVAAAVRDTRDNDTIASIVGGILGALHGKKVIPRRWIEGLSGRVRGRSHSPADDGAFFRLVEQAVKVWGRGEME